MHARIAQVKNLRRLKDAAYELASRPSHLPGVGLLYGSTGHGKTTAAAWLAGDETLNLVYVRASVVWTPAAMFHAILRELGVDAAGSGARLMQLVQDTLGEQGRKLVVVDEADYLATGRQARMSEALRDLHDRSGVAVLLVAMRRPSLSPQLTGRISHWLEFGPADFADSKLLARELCEVELADDLLHRLHEVVHGSVRGMVVGLGRIEQFAVKAGLERVDLATWGSRSFTVSDSGRRS